MASDERGTVCAKVVVWVVFYRGREARVYAGVAQDAFGETVAGRPLRAVAQSGCVGLVVGWQVVSQIDEACVAAVVGDGVGVASIGGGVAAPVSLAERADDVETRRRTFGGVGAASEAVGLGDKVVSERPIAKAGGERLGNAGHTSG